MGLVSRLVILFLCVAACCLQAAEAVRLYIVRHADPEYIDLITGGITEHGRAEARSLAPFLAAEKITHAYSSPMKRALITAELALTNIPKFSTLHNDAEENVQVDHEELHVEKSVFDELKESLDELAASLTAPKNNFQRNVGIEEWAGELQGWQAGNALEKTLLAGTVIWDLPATLLRNRLAETAMGTKASVAGWTLASPDHGEYVTHYGEFCQQADEFLARHGIVRQCDGPNYVMSPEDAADPEKREAKIVLFCHGGQGLTLLAHLLQIPLPIVHANMWLPPSSVTTILFEEYPATAEECEADENVDDQSRNGNESTTNNSDNSIAAGSLVLTPRAIGIGGISHLAVAGLEIPLSKYEGGKRPSGLKHNYW